jgi:hypothetical protein
LPSWRFQRGFPSQLPTGRFREDAHSPSELAAVPGPSATPTASKALLPARVRTRRPGVSPTVEPMPSWVSRSPLGFSPSLGWVPLPVPSSPILGGDPPEGGARPGFQSFPHQGDWLAPRSRRPFWGFSATTASHLLEGAEARDYWFSAGPRWHCCSSPGPFRTFRALGRSSM